MCPFFCIFQCTYCCTFMGSCWFLFHTNIFGNVDFITWNQLKRKKSHIDFTFITKWWHSVEYVRLNSYTFNEHYLGKCVLNWSIVNICCAPGCKTDYKSSTTTQKTKLKNTCFFLSFQHLGLHCFLWDTLVTAVLHKMRCFFVICVDKNCFLLPLHLYDL